MILSEIEKKVIASIQGDVPICEKPYAKLAENAGIPESEFISILQYLNTQGIIRRFGATLRHQKSGFSSNAMVAWKTDEESSEKKGRIMASFSQVSHCYTRDIKSDWPYNLYTMVHASSENECRELVIKMCELSGLLKYEILFSTKELKKTSMTYFLKSDHKNK